jgi:hypothetical protein
MSNKTQFTICLNCDEVFFDTNPTSEDKQPFFEIPKDKGYRNSKLKKMRMDSFKVVQLVKLTDVFLT